LLEKSRASRARFLYVSRFMSVSRKSALVFAAASLAAACSSPAVQPAPMDAAPPIPGTYCARGMNVPGVSPPQGFCLKHYAQVGEARSLALAPNGDLFVGAPSQATSGGATGGPGAVIVLSDDDKDGLAEQSVFAGDIDDVHAVAVGGGSVYFTTKNEVWSTPYTPGQRKETPGARQGLGLPTSYGGGGRWTHGLARSAGGTLVTSRGEYAQCTPAALGGDVSTIGAGGALTVVARGFRNPMYVRCHAKDEVCAAMELGEDTRPGAREKMVMLQTGAAPSYGFPCCFTKDKLASEVFGATCDQVAKEDAEFPLAETPFGFDWEHGVWGAPYAGAVFVALHGSAYSSPSWQGARIVYAKTDPVTHAPIEEWQDFLGGFGPNGSVLERPSDVTFTPEGIMYFADDHGGRVFWMAPLDLAVPAS
jgi:glucose/arabinose dehydrogenase